MSEKRPSPSIFSVSGNVTELHPPEEREYMRILEALLFASAEPLSYAALASRLPEGADLRQLLVDLQHSYASKGVNLFEFDGCWAFRTAPDLKDYLQRGQIEIKKLSRAQLETLAVIAYHQPVTRAEIESIRGVSASKGTLDILMEANWIRIVGKKQTPGRPVLYGTTSDFLDHFSLPSLGDLPGIDELKSAGFLEPLSEPSVLPDEYMQSDLLDDE